MASDSSYGLVYNPRQIRAKVAPSVYDLHKSHINYIRVQWCDYTNIIRCRVIPYDSFLALVRDSSRPGVGMTQACFGLVGVSLAEGFTGTGEYFYIPDMSSLTVCAYAPGHASVMGWYQYKEPPRPNISLDIPYCPRGMLKRIVEYVFMIYIVAPKHTYMY